MVYFYTSGNVKVIKNILKEYDTTSELSPFEFMRSFLEKCPEDSDDAKIGWIAETFLGIKRHMQFLKKIITSQPDEITEDDQFYFIILLYGLIFDINPKDYEQLYKCIFNLSKQLLYAFSNMMCNKQILSFIALIGQSFYDTQYVTEKIIGSLALWQPKLDIIASKYSEFIYKCKKTRAKQVTIPIEPNVLKKRSKPLKPPPEVQQLPPPNSLQSNKKALTKFTIDQRLQKSCEKNKNKAKLLLDKVKSYDRHYAQGKSEKYYNSIEQYKSEMENQKILSKSVKKPVMKKPAAPIKETATTIKRLKQRMMIEEQMEVSWLQDMLNECSNNRNLEVLQEEHRQERERSRLMDIEKKHLMGQISHEEAIIAKQTLIDQNKKNHELMLKEKEIWYSQIEQWKQSEIEKNKKVAEKLSIIELNVIKAKNNALLQRKEAANNVKTETESLLNKALQEKNEELEKRINLIKELKILSMIAKNARIPKVIDMTEIAGFGFLSEMSIAELHERLTSFKIQISEELEKKRNMITENKAMARKVFEEDKKNIQTFLTEKAMCKSQSKKHEVQNQEFSSSKEINDLRKTLEEKRKLRFKMTC